MYNKKVHSIFYRSVLNNTVSCLCCHWHLLQKHMAAGSTENSQRFCNVGGEAPRYDSS